MRRLLAKFRQHLKSHGLDLRPMTNSQTGGYAGFSLNWNRKTSGELRGVIANVQKDDCSARFFVRDERDLIQKEHVAGRFYEREELEIIARHFNGGVFVDVGANVGNHAIFVGAICDADELHLFEPNPQAAELLEVNVALNGLQARTTLHNIALSDADGRAQMEFMTNNLGAAKLSTSDSAEGVYVQLKRGDDVFKNQHIDFIKIDTEGHEVEVIEGLLSTLKRCRPAIFVEVEHDNHDKITSLLEPLNYSIKSEYSRYPGLTNLLLISS